MPGQKKYRKRKRVKRPMIKEKADYKRLIAMTNNQGAIVTNPISWKSVGFPRQKTVTLRYCGGFALTSTSGAIATYKLRANGVYDPDYTGSTGMNNHQPYLHDTWSSLYNHYFVKKAVIKINYCSNVSANVNYVAGMYLADDLTQPIDYTTLVEAGRGTCRVTCGYNTETQIVTSTYSKSKWFGKIPNSAEFGADPTDQAYWVFFVQSADQLSTTGPVTGIVTIEYTIEMSEPKDLPQS